MIRPEPGGFDAARARMVSRDLAGRGIRDGRVLAAMGRVPRERFADAAAPEAAYGDYPLPIACGQTISQPYMVAVMTELLGLSGSERVLEVGTGSGYQAAVLSELAAEVFSMERHAQLSESAGSCLAGLGYRNVRLRVGDGTLGWPEQAPFEAIIVTAGAPDVPASLRRQLADGGRMVLPVNDGFGHRLVLVRRKGQDFAETPGIPCVFVPLVGKEGYPG
jgi:protein-L-isoaspartate(D-aspartate) O-methyltransferase